MATKSQTCSFGGRKKEEAIMLISGLEGNICDQCVDQAHRIVAKELGFTAQADDKEPIETILEAEEQPLPTPAFIKNHLDQYVIGQDEAKRSLAASGLILGATYASLMFETIIMRSSSPWNSLLPLRALWWSLFTITKSSSAIAFALLKYSRCPL